MMNAKSIGYFSGALVGCLAQLGCQAPEQIEVPASAAKTFGARDSACEGLLLAGADDERIRFEAAGLERLDQARERQGLG